MSRTTPLPQLEAQAEEFLRALRGVIERSSGGILEVTRSNGLAFHQFIILEYLQRRGPSHLSSIARLLGIRPQTVTAMVDVLEQGKYVERAQDPEDRRARFVRLTPLGEEKVLAVRSARQIKLARALARNPRLALAQATATLTAVRDLLDEPGNPSGSAVA